MQRICLLCSSLFAIVFAAAGPAAAEGALAVGLPDAGLSHGVVFGWATGGDDDQARAMQYCRGQRTENNDIPRNASEAQRACKIVATFNDQCFAVALNGNQTQSATGFGWAVADSLAAAQSQALAKCTDMAGQNGPLCVIPRTGFGCEGSGK